MFTFKAARMPIRRTNHNGLHRWSMMCFWELAWFSQETSTLRAYPLMGVGTGFGRFTSGTRNDTMPSPSAFKQTQKNG